jgi:hypothetical protein
MAIVNSYFDITRGYLSHVENQLNMPYASEHRPTSVQFSLVCFLDKTPKP